MNTSQRELEKLHQQIMELQNKSESFEEEVKEKDKKIESLEDELQNIRQQLVSVTFFLSFLRVLINNYASINMW